ncbi:MAG: GspH/FimT family pseudopilin [Gammaproteobacteria bacterium]|nr:GspH/FimT family pseudopilin [Gammaproteobacteria bacterium]
MSISGAQGRFRTAVRAPLPRIPGHWDGQGDGRGYGRRDERRLGRRDAAGFTLLELLVVLVLLALLAGFSVPYLVNRGGHEARTSASTLTAALRRSRSVALREHRAAAFTIDVESKWFELPGEQRRRQLPDSLELRLFTARSEMSDEHTGSIRFFPDGSATGGRITLGADPIWYYIDVDWFSGRVTLASGKPEQELGGARGRVAQR